MTKLVKKRKNVKKLGALAEDERFKEVTENVMFKEMKRKDRKIQIDSRFKGMFTDDNFAVGRAKTDIRGRPLGHDERKNLKDLYDVDSEEEEEEETDKKIVLDLARGGGNALSSDEDSEATVDSDLEEDEDPRVKATASVWDRLTSDVKRVEWASKRLAICNMDWDNIKGEELYMVLNSFKPVSGELLTLSIYLSDFGKQSTDNEASQGPKIEPVDKKKLKKNPEEVAATMIRNYQLGRMQYYYAVAEFDSVDTATHVYEQCDRMEYESSGVHLDLRFVPDETEFDETRLKERVDSDTVNVTKFKPTHFETAIKLKNPKLTWDADDRDRRAKFDKAKSNTDDLSDYDDMVAGSDDEADGPSTDKMAALFEAAGIGREREETMKIDWEPIGVESSDEESAEEDEEKEEKEKMIKKKKGGTMQDYLDRKKLMNRERKARVKELKSQAKEADRDRRKEILQQIVEEKKTKRAEMKNNIPADTNDGRFTALFEDADFAIDKSNKKFKGGNLADQQVQIKHERKRKYVDNTEEKPENIDAKSLVEKLKMRANKLKKSKG